MLLFLIAAALATSGCHRADSPPRVAVYGTVKRAGVAVPSATISFLPANGQLGPAATTVVTRGQYRFDTETGPVAGPQRVLIDLGTTMKLGVAEAGASHEASSGRAAAQEQREWEFSLDVPVAEQFEHNVDLE